MQFHLATNLCQQAAQGGFRLEGQTAQLQQLDVVATNLVGYVDEAIVRWRVFHYHQIILGIV